MSEATLSPVAEGSFVLPGDLLDDSGLRGGNGTYKVGGLVYAAQVGYKATAGRSVHVDAVSGTYVPRVGDQVIGTIVGIGPSNWYVEYDAPFQAPLHVNDVPWRVEFGETAKFLGIGDSVLVRVSQVDETKKAFVSMRDRGLRKLTSGDIIKVHPSKVSRLIGREGIMVRMIKAQTGCELFVGQNGTVWLDGPVEGRARAEEAMALVLSAEDTPGLTQQVADLLGADLNNIPSDPVEEGEDSGGGDYRGRGRDDRRGGGGRDRGRGRDDRRGGGGRDRGRGRGHDDRRGGGGGGGGGRGRWEDRRGDRGGERRDGGDRGGERRDGGDRGGERRDGGDRGGERRDGGDRGGERRDGGDRDGNRGSDRGSEHRNGRDQGGERREGGDRSGFGRPEHDDQGRREGGFQGGDRGNPDQSAPSDDGGSDRPAREDFGQGGDRFGGGHGGGDRRRRRGGRGRSRGREGRENEQPREQEPEPSSDSGQSDFDQWEG